MKTLSRAFRLGLSALLLSGSLPLSAAAAMGRIAVAVPAASAGVGAAGAVRVGGTALLSPAAMTLTASPAFGAAPSLGATLSPSLTPSVSLNAALPAVRPVAAPVAPVTRAGAAAVNDGVFAAAPARVLSAPADATGQKTVIAGVETAFTRLQGAKENRPAATGEVLDELFEGFASRRAALNDTPSVSRAAGTTPDRLAPAAAKSAVPADGPRWVLTGDEKPAAPKSSWKRTISAGYLGAIASLVATTIIVGVSVALGHELNPNYVSPAAGIGETPSLLQAGVLFVAASILAPVAEEIVFRAGIQGGLAKVTKFLRLGSFWVPAVLGSLIFVAVHETADPVLFSARFVGAMIFAYVYQKEGMLSSMAMHAFHNGLIMTPILAAAIVGVLGLGAGAAGLLTFAIMGGGLLAAIAYVIKSFRLLRAQSGDIKSGALAPKAFTTQHGFRALLLLAGGFFMLMPNPFWALAGIGLISWLVYHKIKQLYLKFKG